ncbi:MAG: 50S ribosomal protein L4 [Deltaproteobacteria bacterium HGW-Deltaproteobacteria-19]|jgi:large subunit ribosomal protein L4|nr:MAG: 50S ribosomal protein L4 [Deltaproteobacteria bacterium HGW-Deltaproteobacteria-19]
MPLVNVYDIEFKKVSEIELDEAVFGADVNEALLHEVVRMQMASRRSGTASTKERSDVQGSSRKLWRQKGTGRARVGNVRSPIWRKGGVVFGPHPRDYSFKMPKKMRRSALRSALSLKIREEKVLVLNDFPLDEIKTKKFQAVVERLGLKTALFVLDQANVVLEKSSRNIPEIKMIRSEGLNVYDILKYQHLVLLEPSVKKIEGALLS